MAKVKLRRIMGCPGLKSSYQKKGLFKDCYFNNESSMVVVLEKGCFTQWL